MSAPRTNVDKQKRRHLTPLVGIVVAVAFGFGMFLLWMFDVFESTEGADDTNGGMEEASPPGFDDGDAAEQGSSATGDGEAAGE